MNNKSKKNSTIFKKLATSAIVTLIILILVEIALSMLQIFPNDYYTNTPNSEFTWKINFDEIIGIKQDSKVSFDDLGARSTSSYDNKEHKIVVFGGSTTACFALTQEKTWPALLEKKLGDSYWVGNFGRPGNSSNHHTLQFKQILEKPELEDVKTVVIMQGVNDFVGYLISEESYLNSSEQNLKKIAFQHIPNDYLPFFKRFSIYRLASRAKKNIAFHFNHKDYLTKTVMSIKALKKQSKIIEKLPNLTAGLNHYEANINLLIQQAKEKNINLVFITQATMWKPDLAQEYEDLIVTSGFRNNEAFYSTEALYHGMELFNQRLKTVCDMNNMPYLDLKLPKTTASFYDDFHFNESGADLTSTAISDYLKSINLE